MEDKLWYEFVHTKYGDCYLSHYLSAQQNNRKWVKILTLVFSTGGVLGWRIWKQPEFTEISCILIAVVQLFHLIENQIILSDADIAKIAELRTLYLKHCNKLEKLWVDFKAERLTDLQVSDTFFKLREEALKMEELDNKLNVKKRKGLMNKANTEVNAYLSQYHANN